MSSYKKKGDNGELEFTRAAYDTQEDAAELYQVVIQHSIHTTTQRGVMGFTSTVYKNRRPTGGQTVITHTEYWPSATDLSWAAFWFQHCFKLARMIENWALEEIKREAEQAG